VSVVCFVGGSVLVGGGGGGLGGFRSGVGGGGVGLALGWLGIIYRQRNMPTYNCV
jgi:hypothetical protein